MTPAAIPFVAFGGVLGSKSRTEGSGAALVVVGVNLAVTGIVFLIVGAAKGGTKAYVESAASSAAYGGGFTF